MIDWKNLEPLPRKFTDAQDRERLAAISFTRNAAKHKGRCHLSNQKRRAAAQAKTDAGKKTAAQNASRYSRYIDAVRAYWRGEADSCPEKP